jgi:hypothetical protein
MSRPRDKVALATSARASARTFRASAEEEYKEAIVPLP